MNVQTSPLAKTTFGAPSRPLFMLLDQRSARQNPYATLAHVEPFLVPNPLQNIDVLQILESDA